jgi:outer membrane protein assembly factor BamA
VQQLIAQGNYRLNIHCVDRDSAFPAVVLSAPESFSNRFSCVEYVNKLPALLQSKGYVTASLDSVKYDSSSARVVLFAGEVYQWALLNTGQVSPELLDAVGWREKIFVSKPIDFGAIKNWQEKICSYLENNGHPFAKVFLDSLKIEEGKVSADLKVDRGPLYHIDSIHVIGNVKVSSLFLQKYLDIPAKSLYNREKLLKVTKKIRELSYVEETRASDLSLLATGSTLNVYLKPKRSSQVNVLLGFLPNNNQLTSKKLLVTGEANIRLHNALGQGEVIGLNWQQLQVKSPRLNLLYQHPYFLNSPIGLDFAFDMFRKDSTYLNVNMQLGGQYVLSGTQSGKVFIQRFQTIVNTIDTAGILINHHLPEVADVSSVNLGVDYEYNNTDYRFNPRKGNVLHIITSAGTKRIKKNSQVVELKDPNNPGFDFSSLYDTVKLKTYQFRVRATAEKYFQLAKQSTIKTAINAGMFQSGNIFRNELFQIGGYKLLRGFDEESQYLSHFAIGTVEYHYLIGLNSYFYVLADGGWGRSDIEQMKIDYTYLGTGLGLAFETKAGIFNMAWAVGKRSDTDFNLRQSKIHFGFVSYF